MSPSRTCPCGSGQVIIECCGRYHAGEAAPTPEALMRSRYSAFALNLTEYLLASWHPGSRPSSLAPDETTRWVKLRILKGGVEGDEGVVHFHATCREERRCAVLEDRSRFVRVAGRWTYLEGDSSITRLKPGRNDPCPCGNPRKFKSCCSVR